MKKAPKDISARLKRASEELRKLDELLKAETFCDPGVLTEFRYELDTVRLTAWTVSELINAKRARRSSDATLTFLAGERVRRVQQMVGALCADIDRSSIGVKTTHMQSLFKSMNTLQRRIAGQATAQRAGDYRSNSGAD